MRCPAAPDKKGPPENMCDSHTNRLQHANFAIRCPTRNVINFPFQCPHFYIPDKIKKALPRDAGILTAGCAKYR